MVITDKLKVLQRDQCFIRRKPILYCRYVDDIITNINRHEQYRMLSEVNHLHQNLKFTHEAENPGGKISFFDTLLFHTQMFHSEDFYCEIFQSEHFLPSVGNVGR